MSRADPAAAYDAWYATPLGAAAHRIELALVEQFARPQPGERALDVGCGTGVYAAWLAGRGLRVNGVDRDPAMLAAAAAKAPAAELVLAEASALPFPDASTAVALLDRLLHHATVVATAGESFRMKEAKTRGCGRPNSR